MDPVIPPDRCCAAVECRVPVEPLYLFCPIHRSMLPDEKRTAIRENCKPGTPIGLRPSGPWIEAAAEAVEWLAEAEHRDRQNRFREALQRAMSAPLAEGQGG